MRSEFRSQIDQKYAKKIEAIVRKAPNGIKETEDAYQDEAQPCPICECSLQIMELTCHQCKTNLPMCIATVSALSHKFQLFRQFQFIRCFDVFLMNHLFILIGSTYCKRRRCRLSSL